MEEIYFDDCPVCRAQKKAVDEGRPLSLAEYFEAAKEAEKGGSVTSGSDDLDELFGRGELKCYT